MTTQLHAFVLISALAVTGLAYAAEPDHSKMDHSKADDSNEGQAANYTTSNATRRLRKLDAIAPGGKAREATFDGRYAMEPSAAPKDLATRCAQASRGLVMVDNATWKKCGGKPEGAAKGPGHYPALAPWNKAGNGQAEPMDHSTMDHSKMNH